MAAKKKKTTKAKPDAVVNVSVRLNQDEYNALQKYAERRMWPLGTAMRMMLRKEAMGKPLLRPIVPKKGK